MIKKQELRVARASKRNAQLLTSIARNVLVMRFSAGSSVRSGELARFDARNRTEAMALPRLAAEYMTAYQRARYFQGDLKREMLRRVRIIGDQIRAIDPAMEWDAIKAASDSYATDTNQDPWDDEAERVIAWLFAWDVRKQQPFMVKSGWPVPDPALLKEQLLLVLALGPQGAHFALFLDDLKALANAVAHTKQGGEACD